MGHALETVEDCKTLIERPLLTLTVGKYSYRIERKGTQSDYSVSDGAKTLTLPIRWVMGASSAIGQTFVLIKDGELYESRVSYFRDIQGLGPTLGSEGSVPGNITEAAGRLMTQQDKLSCFGCHATDARSGGQLTLDKMSPGVQCAHCHKDTDTHLAAMLLNSYDLESHKGKAKPHLFAAEQVSDFCGQCHRTWAEIAMQPNPGIANIRFQPYRLAGSKCYDVDDARISCLACHDPHREVSANPLDYDAKCLACHGGKKARREKLSKIQAKLCDVSHAKAGAPWGALQVQRSSHSHREAKRAFPRLDRLRSFLRLSDDAALQRCSLAAKRVPLQATAHPSSERQTVLRR